MRTISLIALISLAVTSAITTAQVKSPSYNAIEVSYSNADYDNYSDADIFGPQVTLSYALSENFFIEGNYESLAGDVAGAKFKTHNSHLMMGYHSQIDNASDYYIGLSYEYGESELSDEFGTRSNDTDGFGVTVGAKGFIDDGVLLDGYLKHVDTGDSSGVVASLGLQYFLTDETAFVAKYNAGKDITRYNFGIRYQF